MTWVARLANVVKLAVYAGLEVVGLVTELARVLITKMDEAVDDLQAKLTTGTPPNPPP